MNGDGTRGTECLWGMSCRGGKCGFGCWLVCSAAYSFLSRAVSLSISACFRRTSFSSASSIFFTRFVSALSALFCSRSSSSTCVLRRAVSASISHWVRGSVGGGRDIRSCFGGCPCLNASIVDCEGLEGDGLCDCPTLGVAVP